MSLSALDRRTVLQSGAAAAGFFALVGARSGAAAACIGPTISELAGSLVGWVVLQSNGSGRIDVFEVDSGLQPLRHLVAEDIPALPLAGAARNAAAAMCRVGAAFWNVNAGECDLRAGHMIHAASGRSVPAAVWVDFI